MVTGYSTGHPVRVLKNKLSKQLEMLDRQNKPEEIETLGAGKLALAMRTGDCDMGSLMAGQCAALVTRIQPAAEIIAELVSETESVIAALPARVGR